MGKRDSQILELLTARKRMEVVELAKELGVSSVTMRKDLDELEAREVIKREHGYAVIGNPIDIKGRLAFHYETKQAIARRALDFVEPNETVMIESGSCCALLALALAQSDKSSTIITNSAFIASYIRRDNHAGTVLLGGDFQNDAEVSVGPMVRQCAENFFVRHLFIGVDSFSPAVGFTNSDHLRAQAVRDMAQQAEHVVVLTESAKFGQLGVAPLKLDGKIDAVITDNKIELATIEELESRGIQVSIVEA
jgi:DeoR/GlpR family transcriptional regulator of sugar metabolism